jgi:hypothetical protein
MSDISENFKDRFIASLPTVPAGYDLHLDAFVVYDSGTLPARLAKEDAEFLAIQGLPRQAPPFLAFYAYSQPEIESFKRSFAIPESCFPIGHNGSGDALVIYMDSREVVYFNHDNYDDRVFINSSLPQFAESLCIYQEHVRKRAMANCLDAITTIDSRAAGLGTMWRFEVDSELADEA